MDVIPEEHFNPKPIGQEQQPQPGADCARHVQMASGGLAIAMVLLGAVAMLIGRRIISHNDCCKRPRGGTADTAASSPAVHET